MAVLIYALCALTALVCAALLLLGARRTGSRMLFWSGLCFACFSITNAMVVIDGVESFLPGWDFGTARLAVALVGVSLLLYGLIFEEA